MTQLGAKPDSSLIRKQIQKIKEIPMLSSVAQHVVQLVQNPKVSVALLGKVVAKDPALAVKVLRISNSAYYGFPKQIKTISHALVILGFNQLVNLIVTASVMDIGRGKKNDERLNLPKLWYHSIATGLMAQNVSKTLLIGDADFAYLAGLLHDLGKAIMSVYLNKYYPLVLDERDKTDCLLFEAEKTVLGLTHARVSSWITEDWNLPETIILPLKFHHTPRQCPGSVELTYIVHLADILVRAIGLGDGGDSRIPEIAPIVWEKLHLSFHTVDKLLETGYQNIQKASDFFEVIKAS